MTANRDMKGLPDEQSGLDRDLRHIMARTVTADDMTQAHDAWSPDEATDTYTRQSVGDACAPLYQGPLGVHGLLPQEAAPGQRNRGQVRL